MTDKTTRIDRLEIIKREMILNYLTEIDFNSDENKKQAYDTMLYKVFVSGEFDDIFLSDSLNGLDKEERQRIMDLARKYNSLCFYHGNFDYWSDSVEGVTEGDNMTAEILLSNYDYLIRLAKNGGENVLKFLNKFRSNEKFNKGAIIALLINRFWGDLDSLEIVLIEMVKENGKYKDFTDTQKIMLCEAPDGLLFKKNDSGKIEYVDSEDLKKSISNAYIGMDDCSMSDINSEQFERIIQKINTECLMTVVSKE